MAVARRQCALPVVLLGTGGHAAVLVDALQRAGRRILGCVGPVGQRENFGPLGCEVLGDETALSRYRPDGIELANGVGATDSAITPGGQTRSQLHRTWCQRGFTFATVVHPAATIGAACDLAAGVQIMAGAVVQTGTRLGAGTIVNTAARLDHDCIIGDLVHIAPGATLCGAVSVGDGAFIGAGATLIPGVMVGAGARIGAGMTILGDVAAAARLAPAADAAWRGPATMHRSASRQRFLRILGEF